MEENEKVMNRGGEPADGTPLLLGIAKASLSTDSFISAAWFQVRWTDAGEPPVQCARGDLRLLWNDERIAHIGRHSVLPEEFEEVCFGTPSSYGRSRPARTRSTTSWVRPMRAGIYCVSLVSFRDGRRTL